jgi:hypothetical protein
MKDIKCTGYGDSESSPKNAVKKANDNEVVEFDLCGRKKLHVLNSN